MTDLIKIDAYKRNKKFLDYSLVIFYGGGVFVYFLLCKVFWFAPKKYYASWVVELVQLEMAMAVGFFI